MPATWWCARSARIACERTATRPATQSTWPRGWKASRRHHRFLFSQSTHKLAEGDFEFKALAHTQLNGLREQLGVYEVLGLGVLLTRLQVGAQRGLVLLVGCEAESKRLGEVLELAGARQMVGLVAEADVGKLRLFHEFKARTQQGWMVLETFSVSDSKAFPYLPLNDPLRNYFRTSRSRSFRGSPMAR